mmetsp:Transcript_3590/g.11073  ORF Transcript_3590/g.11073 Transcript_3590/m.11073 type:complete len:219 (-) Transcript_3590:656-1312(-)
MCDKSTARLAARLLTTRSPPSCSTPVQSSAHTFSNRSTVFSRKNAPKVLSCRIDTAVTRVAKVVASGPRTTSSLLRPESRMLARHSDTTKRGFSRYTPTISLATGCTLASVKRFTRPFRSFRTRKLSPEFLNSREFARPWPSSLALPDLRPYRSSFGRNVALDTTGSSSSSSSSSWSSASSPSSPMESPSLSAWPSSSSLSSSSSSAWSLSSSSPALN